jgi:hypothetical protein
MVHPRQFLQVFFWISLTMGAAAAALAGDLKSPDTVKTGLYKLAAEYDDMDRKLAAERYDRLPHENQEFQEESQLLRTAVANEPAEFKGRVESALQSALTAATHVADVSATHDKGQVTAALENLSTLLQSLNALFPENLRTEPGTVKKSHPASAQ